MKLLVLYTKYSNKTAYYDDWLSAFVENKNFDTTEINLYDFSNIKLLKNSIKQFPFIVLLHSTNADSLKYLFPYVNILLERRGKLLFFVGNELNYPFPGQRMSDKINLLKKLQPEFIASQLLEETATQLYGDVPNARILPIPHGLNHKRYYPAISFEQRNIYIGSRNGKYYPFMGDDDRNEIINYFSSLKFDSSLNIDIKSNYSDKFSPDEWAKFLNNCQFTISSESGTHFLEKDDILVKEIDSFLRKNNKTPLLNNYQKIFSKHRKFFNYPFLIKLENKLRQFNLINYSIQNSIHYNTTLDELTPLFFKSKIGFLNGKCISSRHFEAIGTKTCQILTEGRYNDILKKDIHYISLKSNFSNIKEVLEKMKDLSFVKKMVNDTYEFVLENHKYDDRINYIYEIFSHE